MKTYAKFYTKTPQERRDILAEKGCYDTHKDIPLAENIYNNMIENAITTYELPLGVVPEFAVNQKLYCVPLVTEEPSVIAALNHANKLLQHYGSLKAQVLSRTMRGQIAFMNPKDTNQLMRYLEDNQTVLKNVAETAYPSLVGRGGGLQTLEINIHNTAEYQCLVVNVLIDTQEAMGANMINTIVEALAHHIATSTDETPLLSILSNYNDHALTEATCSLDLSSLENGALIAKRIEEASVFAEMDVHRATTHNKGIMNGIDALVIALGNDWRSVAAAIHAYASQSGTYQPLSIWRANGSLLEGQLTVPLALASVGGSIGIHPKAQLSHTMLKNIPARELMELTAAVGLAQNFAALYALVTDGIQKGHMELQARSLALQAGADEQEIVAVVTLLAKDKPMNLRKAHVILETLRKKKE